MSQKLCLNRILVQDICSYREDWCLPACIWYHVIWDQVTSSIWTLLVLYSLHIRLFFLVTRRLKIVQSLLHFRFIAKLRFYYQTISGWIPFPAKAGVALASRTLNPASTATAPPSTPIRRPTKWSSKWSERRLILLLLSTQPLPTYSGKQDILLKVIFRSWCVVCSVARLGKFWKVLMTNLVWK